MEAKAVWKEKMLFVGESGGHQVPMDTRSPLGNDSALTPKELVAVGLCGCTAMDVVALMKKHKQPLEALEVLVDAPVVEKGRPPVFEVMNLSFKFKGQLDVVKVVESVKLSQTKYCAVSAMLVKAAPINYRIFLNDKEVGSGSADFGGAS